MQAHKVGLGIVDPPAGKGIDMDIRFVARRNGYRLPVPFEESLVDSVHGLDERQFHVQARLGDRFADGLAELGNDNLLSLVDRIETSEKATQEQQCAKNRQQPKTAPLIHFTSGILVESGRIGSNCFIESSMMIFGPIVGSTSPIVSR
jgi:hypothetical protein